MGKPDVSLERLKILCDYDPSTGVFASKVWRGPIKVGQVLGGVCSEGYTKIQIDEKLYYAHRLAWMYMHGRLPDCAIDHRDGGRSNNAIDNLRLALGSINQQNQRKPRQDNKSGYLGVSQHKDGKWTARIKTAKTYQHLGLYATPELASQAYLSAKRQHHEGNTL